MKAIELLDKVTERNETKHNPLTQAVLFQLIADGGPENDWSIGLSIIFALDSLVHVGTIRSYQYELSDFNPGEDSLRTVYIKYCPDVSARSVYLSFSIPS